MSTPTAIDLLSEVRQEIATAEAHIAKLRGIEEYLSGKLSATADVVPAAPLQRAAVPAVYANSSRIGANGIASQPVRKKLDPNISQRDGAEVALRELGGEAQVADIMRKMLALGYENPNRNTSETVLKNSIYSAMLRSPDRFERVGRGRWRLRQQSDDLDSQDDGSLFGEEDTEEEE